MISNCRIFEEADRDSPFDGLGASRSVTSKGITILRARCDFDYVLERF